MKRTYDHAQNSDLGYFDLDLNTRSHTEHTPYIHKLTQVYIQKNRNSRSE